MPPNTKMYITRLNTLYKWAQKLPEVTKHRSHVLTRNSIIFMTLYNLAIYTSFILLNETCIDKKLNSSRTIACILSVRVSSNSDRCCRCSSRHRSSSRHWLLLSSRLRHYDVTSIARTRRSPSENTRELLRHIVPTSWHLEGLDVGYFMKLPLELSFDRCPGVILPSSACLRPMTHISTPDLFYTRLNGNE